MDGGLDRVKFKREGDSLTVTYISAKIQTLMILEEIQKLMARLDSMDAKMDLGFADVRAEM